ncbi:MAG: alkaline phosphatase family protein [bacterium]
MKSNHNLLKHGIWRVWIGPILIWAVLLGVLWVVRSGVLAPKRTKVLLIGIDGLEWSILNPLIEQNRVPNLAKMVNEGTSGTLMSRDETLSPIIWTTIATGRKREKHQIMGFFKESGQTGGTKKGTFTPVTSADRKVPALWNIASYNDRPVGVLGWWASWPAEHVIGTIISGFTSYDPKSTVRRGVHAGEDLSRLTWPESVQKEIEPLMVDIDSVSHEDLDRFVNVDNWNDRMFVKERVSQGVNYVLPWTYATDLSYANIAEYLLKQNKYDLFMTYIQGTDTCCHRFWEFQDRCKDLQPLLTEYDLYPEEEQTCRKYFGDTINKYYEFTDELVGRLTACIDDNTVVIICSDHGFGDYTGGEPRWEGKTFSGSHRLEGSIIMWGPGIRKGKKLSEENPRYIWDIAPTVLALMELPLANDMPGTPIIEAFDPRLTKDFKPEFVVSYDINYKQGEVPERVIVDQEYIERLRSLGYVQ